MKAIARTALEATGISIVLTAIVFIPQWRFGFNWSDEGILWYLSQRTLAGDLPIRDFFSYDPGRYFWSAFWFAILGHDGLLEQRVANAVFGAVGLTVVYASLISARIPFVWRITTAILIAMALGYPRHKTYEQGLSLISTACLMFVIMQPKRIARWVIFGVASGLAAFFGRNSGVYFVVAAALALWFIGTTTAWRDAFKSAIAYGCGVVVGYLPILWMLITDQRFSDAFIDSIKFTANWQLPLPIPFPWRQHPSISSILDAQQIAVSWLCIGIFVAYSVALARLVIRLKRNTPFTKRHLLETAALLSGLPYLHQAFDRADFSHIAQGSMPIFLLLVAQCFGEARKYFIAQYAIIASLACASWLPSEPRISFHILQHQNSSQQTQFKINGRKYFIGSEQAQVLTLIKREAMKCSLKDGQFLAAPYYPGLYAYLHIRAPFWELYYLYKRSDEFQIREIKAIENYKVRIILINEKDAVDGKDYLRISNTNPYLLSYIKNNFSKTEFNTLLPDGFDIYEHECDKSD